MECAATHPPGLRSKQGINALAKPDFFGPGVSLAWPGDGLFPIPLMLVAGRKWLQPGRPESMVADD